MLPFQSKMPQNCWRLGLRPRPRWESLQRSPGPLVAMVWDGDLVTTLVWVISVPHCLWPVPRCFEAGYRPGHRMFDWFEMHICMKHVIYYRLVITLNVAPLKVTNWLHWIALFQVWIFNISQERGLPRPLPSSSNFVLHTDAWGLATLHLSHTIGFLPTLFPKPPYVWLLVLKNAIYLLDLINRDFSEFYLQMHSIHVNILC